MKHFYLPISGKITWLSLVAILLSTGLSHGQLIATFESLQLEPEAYWKDIEGDGGFQNGNAYFYSSYISDWDMWSGFIYSNSTNTIDGEYTNDYSAITGKGYMNSANYAVSNGDGAGIKLINKGTVSGFFATNTTYTYLTMKNGGSFMGKKFGGTDGTDPDYFVLTVYGYLGGIKVQDTVNFYLADFRSEDSNQDYIVNTWEWVDLKTLGEIDSLSFGYTTTDFNEYGPLTPSYFAMDNVGDGTITANYVSANLTWNVFPNPAQDVLHITLPADIAKGIIKVSDLSGNTLVDQAITPGSDNTLWVQNLNSGAYIISIQTENYSSIKTFLKQ